MGLRDAVRFTCAAARCPRLPARNQPERDRVDAVPLIGRRAQLSCKPSSALTGKNIADTLEHLGETWYAAAGTIGERADVHLEAQEDLHVLTASVDGTLSARPVCSPRRPRCATAGRTTSPPGSAACSTRS
ncbi:hypothetical protein OOK36_32795 [Streptomyces sp. NBC_00365]|uniref:hypothetical protein n=1 Tax=Streptomyces sp. NBC_00365 TaxID=2975726 RepID=UPI0022598951|nr:hypothetical protein [Streptomyces sp. NBC_00365]MCX5093584.1 hypothetical protein [Streptomyces sp. NBC_00365]